MAVQREAVGLQKTVSFAAELYTVPMFDCTNNSKSLCPTCAGKARSSAPVVSHRMELVSFGRDVLVYLC